MSEESGPGEETRLGMLEESAFRIVQRHNAAVIEVTGDLDISNAGQLEAALERALATDPRHVVISLVRRRLLIVAPAGTTSRRVLEIAGGAAAYPPFDSVEHAIASLTR